MDDKQQPWYLDWFNEDYLKLYTHRDAKEAQQQVDFLFRALKLTGKEKVLDLGCGTGRHALLLAKRGLEVIGIDASPLFIAKAKEQLAQDPTLPAQFYVHDMRNSHELGTFDVVLSLFTSFGYFPTDAENAQVLTAVSECLVEQGQFLLDYLHPDQVKRSLVPRETKRIGNDTVEIAKKIEGNSVIKEIAFPHKTYQERVKLYIRDELEKMLSAANLHVETVWNDYQGNPWKKHGDRQLFLCRKRKDA